MKKTSKDLFEKLGLDKISDDDKFTMTEELGGVLLQRIADRMEAILTAGQIKQFETKLAIDGEQAFQLLEEFVPEYSLIVSQESEALKKEMLDGHAAILEKLDNLQNKSESAKIKQA